ncbi:hypothetical protein RhiJN_27508 [Ceratobasidium sp. AG-Ba]|nr:hypothetical protein RhiJN_13445 [Ceratobasidium sp. AG-Ba]QRV99489.1 hypothetical protein RhiJN_27508 [Ceratobasidium sp. AG-Ba]QRW13999.1 hypothetical protein RhiLY_12998 [Ceratobasidium sp. AG-Ba]
MAAHIPNNVIKIPLSISHFSIYQPPPCPIVARTIPALEEHVTPKQKSEVGHKKPDLTPLALQDLTIVLQLMRPYVAKPEITWEEASKNIAWANGYQETHARALWTWARACLVNPSFTPCTSYGRNHNPLIEDDEFQKKLLLYLRAVGKYATSASIVEFTKLPDVQEDWGLAKPISVRTAERWMHILGYCWGQDSKGMYIDGHERPDVVEYCQNTYL